MVPREARHVCPRTPPVKHGPRIRRANTTSYHATRMRGSVPQQIITHPPVQVSHHRAQTCALSGKPPPSPLLPAKTSGVCVSASSPRIDLKRRLVPPKLNTWRGFRSEGGQGAWRRPLQLPRRRRRMSTGELSKATTPMMPTLKGPPPRINGRRFVPYLPLQQLATLASLADPTPLPSTGRTAAPAGCMESGARVQLRPRASSGRLAPAASSAAPAAQSTAAASAAADGSREFCECGAAAGHDGPYG